MVGFGNNYPTQVWHKLSYNTQLTYPLAGKTIYSAGELMSRALYSCLVWQHSEKGIISRRMYCYSCYSEV